MSTFTSDPQFGRGQTLGGYQTLTANDGTTVVGFQKFFSDSDPKTSEFFSNRSVGWIARIYAASTLRSIGASHSATNSSA